MIIEYSDFEQNYINQIWRQYEADRDASGLSKEEYDKKHIIEPITAVADYRVEVERDYMAQFQRDPDKIYKDAVDQVRLVVDREVEKLHQMIEVDNIDFLTNKEIATKQAGKYKLLGSYLLEVINKELAHHTKELTACAGYRERLFDAILAHLQQRSEVDSRTLKVDADEYLIRKYSLSTLKRFAITNDQHTNHFLSSGGILDADADGQYKWIFSDKAETTELAPIPQVALTLLDDEDDKKVSPRRRAKASAAFDKSVHDIIATQYYYWCMERPDDPLIITPKEILACLNGLDLKNLRDYNPSPNQIEKVNAAMRRLMATLVDLNISEEFFKAKSQFAAVGITSGIITETLLNGVSGVEFFSKQKNVYSGYIISKSPIMFRYNLARHNLVYVDYKLLDISDYTRGEYAIEFRDYLLKEISRMKRGKRSRKVKIETIYRYTGADAERINDAARSKKDRKTINAILDSFVDKKFIESWKLLDKDGKELKAPKKADSYEITLKEVKAEQSVPIETEKKPKKA